MTFRNLRRYVGGVVIVVLVISLVFVARNPHAIADWYRLRNYQAPQDIVAIADKTTMTDQARRLFYINHPKVQDKQAFRASCPQYGEQTIVIGCYEGGQRGIFVLKVTDQRLQGVEEVTAAHEMLHAAYERLDKADKQRVDGMLQNYADTALSNQRIKDALQSYKKTEPGQELNEMHSMFGTEIGNLPAELESYYGQYFSARTKVVAAADAYQAAFTSRRDSIAQYDNQLELLNTQIKSDTQSLNAQSTAIDRQRTQLETYRNSNDIESYNSGVEPFNAKVNAYNSLLDTARAKITQYNKIVAERNAIAAQTLELQQAIDSDSLPQSQ